MFSFFRNFFKKNKYDINSDSVTSINFPDHFTIESVHDQSGGVNKYYDNIYSRNVSKF